MSNEDAKDQAPTSLRDLFDGVPEVTPADAWAVAWDGGKVKADCYVGPKRCALNTYDTVASAPEHFGRARLFVCREVLERELDKGDSGSLL